MTCAGATRALEIAGRRYECSKAERENLNEVFTRLSSLECDICVSLFTSYVEYDAREERNKLAQEFRTGVARLAEAARAEGTDLGAQTGRNAESARGVLGKASEVAAASEQSAVAMHEA